MEGDEEEMSDESKNPADLAAKIIKREYARVGLKYFEEPVEAINWREALFSILDAFAANEGVIFEETWTEFGVSAAERDLILSQWKAREK